eukprot:107761-Chlamydomonas_euryale.AAC.3
MVRIAIQVLHVCRHRRTQVRSLPAAPIIESCSRYRQHVGPVTEQVPLYVRTVVCTRDSGVNAAARAAVSWVFSLQHVTV